MFAGEIMSKSDFDVVLKTPPPAPALDELTPVEQVRDQLPMGEEVQDRFIAAARSQYLDGSEMDDLRLFNSLLNFVHRLPRSQDLEDTRTLHEAIQGFIWDLTQPLRTAEKRVAELEGQILDQLKTHPATVLEPSDFEADPMTTESMLKDYLELCHGLVSDITAVRRDVLLAKRLFVDSDCLIITMRNRLHDLENIICGQAGRTEGTLRYKEFDIPRRKWLEGLRTGLDDLLDLMPYLKKAYPESKVSIVSTDESTALSEPFVMRNIARHWIRNALDKGATEVEVQLQPYDDEHYVFSVMDDVPGGFPRSVRSRLGKEQILHHDDYEGGSGFEIICKHLAPQLGPGARIVIETPLKAAGGSRVSVIFPRTLPEQKSSPAGNGLANYRSKPVPVNFVEMDAPDWTVRVRTDDFLLDYYRRVTPGGAIFDRLCAGGLRVFRPDLLPRKPVGMTFRLTPRIG